jgi:hypothetical protein
VTRPARALSWAAGLLGISLALVALVEGGSSLLLFAFDAVSRVRGLAEEYSTHYDAELGWVARPDFDSPDFYGPGRGLRTERHGFRNDEDVAPEVPAGRVRMVCSGDSFTLSYGVGNDAAWCHVLGQLLDVEAVNMGQGGYGVDQAYLWYMRDGIGLEHQLQLFAFIEGDFARAQGSSFLGFPKPVLTLVDGELTATNVPVPRSGWLRRRLAAASAEMRFVRLLEGVERRIPRRREDADARNAATLAVVGAMFERLADVNRQKASRLVIVDLPTKKMHARSEPSYWQKSISELAESLRIPFIDLTPRLGRLSCAEVEDLYMQPEVVPHDKGGGHYTEAGNRWVAEILEAELRAIPAVAELLPSAGQGTAAARGPRRPLAAASRAIDRQAMQAPPGEVLP